MKMTLSVLVFATAALAIQAGSQKEGPRAWLGFGYTIHTVNSRAGERQWLYLRRVEPNSPASAAGLRVQDAVVAIDGKPVRFVSAVAGLEFFSGIRVGSVLRLKVLRRGMTHVVTLRAAELPSMYLEAWKKNEELAKQEDASRKTQ